MLDLPGIDLVWVEGFAFVLFVSSLIMAMIQVLKTAGLIKEDSGAAATWNGILSFVASLTVFLLTQAGAPLTEIVQDSNEFVGALVVVATNLLQFAAGSKIIYEVYKWIRGVSPLLASILPAPEAFFDIGIIEEGDDEFDPEPVDTMLKQRT